MVIRTSALILLLSASVIADTSGSAAMAQMQVAPPAIVAFGGDLTAITLADAEAGQTPLTLAWQVVGMTDDYRLTLERNLLNGWESLLRADDDPLPPIGTRIVTVQHPLSFAPPTYRLSVLNGESRVVDERYFILPYDTNAPAHPPSIEDFSTSTQQVGADALARGTAIIPVSWKVANRPLYANLVFEQMLPDGRAVSVELPRPNLWVPSAGQGPTRPVYPGSGEPVHLRFGLVDMVSGEVYDERELLVAVSGTPDPPPVTAAARTPVPPPIRTPESQARIVSFVVTPDMVDRSGTVTLRWEVQNAASVTVWRVEPGGPVAEFLENQPLSGAWTVQLRDYYVDSAQFMLWATDAAGVSTSASLTVKVRCPYTYFFAPSGPGDACPAREAQQVAAVYQTFERGAMVWRSDQRQIYGLYAGGRLGRYQDTWVDGEAVTTGEPPAGLIAPARGFGKVWANEIGVRDGLGWATGPETPYTMTVQVSGAYKYSRTYLTLPDGRVIYLVETSWGLVGS